MKSLGILIKRNIKLFFKDKAMFFTSLITPIILLVLFVTFLGNVYKSNFVEAFNGFDVPEKVIDGLVGGQLFSSLLAVCCVTVSFCSNMIMVQDKAMGAYKDLMITPLKKSTLALSYYIATLINTLIICILATLASFIYIANCGWYLSVSDVFLLFLDVFLLVMFGTALSSIINCFLTTQGQISAVGTIVSSCYGFICGAYMPISNFSKFLQNVLSFLPGTYGTSLLRNHAMQGVINELSNYHLPNEAIESIKKSIDCNVYFFDNLVSTTWMYVILITTVVLLVTIYIALQSYKSKKHHIIRKRGCKETYVLKK